MKFTVNAGRVKVGLKPVVDVADKGVVRDFDTAFKVGLDAKNGELVCSSYGGKLSIRTSLNDVMDTDLAYACDTKGSVTVNATDLFNTVSSFEPDKKIQFHFDGKSLIISYADDEEEYQSLPVFPDSIQTPTIADKFDKEIELTRGAFLHGINKIYYAVGFESTKERYLYWTLKVKKENISFAAGTGGRFAIFSMSGTGFLKADAEQEFFVPKDQTPVILSILDNLDDEQLRIKQAARTKVSVEQIIFETDSIRLVIVGFDPNINWPDTTKIIESKKTYKIKTVSNGWEYPTKGLTATFNAEVRREHEGHQASMDANVADKCIRLSSKTIMKAVRKVPIVEIIEQGEENSMKFYTLAPYIAEIFSRSEKDQEITIEFIDHTRPIVVKYPSTTNDSLGVEEQLTTFFASLKG